MRPTQSETVLEYRPAWLRERNEHDIHDHNAADHQRNRGNPDHRKEKRLTEIRPDTQQAGISLDIKAVVVARPVMAASAQNGAGFVHRLFHPRTAGGRLARDPDTVVRTMLFLKSRNW